MVYLVKNSFWVSANTVITSVFAFALSVAFARFVGKETYGTYQFLLSLSSILGALTLTGMNSAVTQAVARGFEGVFKNSVKTQIKFGVIPFLVGVATALYYLINGNQTLSLSILIVASLLPIANALNTWSYFLGGKKDFKNSFLYGQIINFIYYVGMIFCIFIFPNAIILISINFLLLTISNLIVYFIVINRYKPNENNEEEALSYGKKLSLSSILPAIALNIDNILVFHFLGAASLAIYAFASNIPERLGGFLRPISTIAMPKFSEKDPEIIKQILPQKTFQLFVIAAVAGLFYILIAPFIFKIFFPSYLESVIYSQVYAIAIIINITGSLSLMSMFAKRSNKIHTLNITYPVFNIAILSIGGYFFGIWGIILGKITSNLFLLASTLYYNKTS